MKYQPHDYQKECINFMHSRDNSGLYLDMGLGKTSIVLQAILDNMYDRLEVKRTIVIAPKRVALIAWPAELKKWDAFRNIPYTVLHGKDKLKNLLRNRRLYIINYDGLPWLLKQYQDKKLCKALPKFDMLVLDESTFVKNTSTKRYKIIKALFGQVKKKVLLTGTPAPNSLLDLYGQINIIAPDLLGKSFESYKNHYFFADDWNGYRWLLRQGSKKLIADRIAPLVKVMKAKDYLDMKEFRLNTIECALPANVTADYKQLEKEFFVELDTGAEVEAFNSAALAMKLRQFTQGFVYHEGGEVSTIHKVKIEALKELIEGANGKPILCAIQFKHEVEMIREALKKDIPAMYSGTSDKQGQINIDAWNKGELPLLLANPQSISHGLNLQDGGNLIVWFGITWSLEQYDQLIGRLHRQGQKEGVIVHHLIMKDTIDEAVMSALKDKSKGQAALISALKAYRENSQ